MSTPSLQPIQVHPALEDYPAASTFMRELLSQSGVSGHEAAEIELVFETLFNSLILQGYGEDTALWLWVEESLGDVGLQIGFEGARFAPPSDALKNASVEDRLLKGYEDKIDYRYHTGYNTVRISVKRSYTRNLLLCAAGILLAIVAYGLLGHLFDEQACRNILDQYVLPIEGMFSNAILMAGAPVTLFSMLKNSTDYLIIGERGPSARRAWAKMISSSVGAILLALLVGWFWQQLLGGPAKPSPEAVAHSVEWSFADIVGPAVPSSIIEPLETISPFPLIIVALLVTYALCSVGKYFDMLKSAIDACYALFSRMLRAVMAALPFFCFMAFLDLLLSGGHLMLLVAGLHITITYISLVVLVLAYVVRLIVGRVDVRMLLRGIGPLIRENLKIGSVIEAVPFNIRYCSKRYGMDRSVLEKNMPVLAQANLDGNCFIILLATLLFISVTGLPVAPMSIVVIAILVLFLSFGAPNQPGSILIGILIITNFLKLPEMIPMAIYLEVFLGASQNIANVLGDVVAVAVEDRRVKSGRA